MQKPFGSFAHWPEYPYRAYIGRLRGLIRREAAPSPKLYSRRYWALPAATIETRCRRPHPPHLRDDGDYNDWHL